MEDYYEENWDMVFLHNFYALFNKCFCTNRIKGNGN